jgi:hypothetical protein
MTEEYNPSIKSTQSIFLMIILIIVIVVFIIIILNKFGLKDKIDIKLQDNLPESNYFDCNKDLSCFINSVETKKQAKYLYEFTDSDGLLNTNYKIEFKVSDYNDVSCKLNLDVLDINSLVSNEQRTNLLSSGLTNEEIDSEVEQINSINITLVGIKQECNFNEITLLEVLNSENNFFKEHFTLDQNTYSGIDYNCIRIYD